MTGPIEAAADQAARQEAIDAAARALWVEDGWIEDDYPEKALTYRLGVGATLDAIPDEVLVRYAIERGALIPTGKSHWTGPDARRHVDQYAPTYFAKAHR